MSETKSRTTYYRPFLSVLQVMLAGVITWWLIRQIDFKLLSFWFEDIRIGLVVAAICSAMSVIWFNSIKWRFCLLDNSNKFNNMQIFISYWTSFSIDMLLPSGYGGDFLRFKDINYKISTSGQSVASIFASRFSGLITSIVVFCITGLFVYQRLVDLQLIWVWYTLLCIFCVSVLIIGMRWHKLFQKKIIFHTVFPEIIDRTVCRFIDHLSAITKNKYYLYRIFFFSILAQLMMAITHYFLSFSVNVPLSFFDVMLLVCLVNFSLILQITPGGLGVKESVYVLFFMAAGLPGEKGLIVALLHRSIQLLLTAGGAAIIPFRRRWLY